MLDFERCTLALINDDGETYRLQTLLETRRTVDSVAQESVPLAQGIAGMVMRTRQMRLISDVADEKDNISQPIDPALWDGSLATVLALPLQAYGNVLGALTFAIV